MGHFWLRSVTRQNGGLLQRILQRNGELVVGHLCVWLGEHNCRTGSERLKRPGSQHMRGSQQRHDPSTSILF